MKERASTMSFFVLLWYIFTYIYYLCTHIRYSSYIIFDALSPVTSVLSFRNVMNNKTQHTQTMFKFEVLIILIGVTPGITKPEMKRQMRSLINQINGVEEKYPFKHFTQHLNNIIYAFDVATEGLAVTNSNNNSSNKYKYNYNNSSNNNFLSHYNPRLLLLLYHTQCWLPCPLPILQAVVVFQTLLRVIFPLLYFFL